jgi:hypothetical protein
MEIGEPVGVVVSALSPGEKCWACESDPPEQRTNNLNEDPDSIGEPENNLTNDSSALGSNLGHRPTWTISVPDEDNGQKITRSCDVVPAAHHLIPGNASLKNVPKMLDLIEASRGKIQADIGYDINSAQNGIWLPANYGVRADSAFGKKWKGYSFKDDYARAAMKRAGAQFHDAHPTYSDNTIRTLRSIADKVNLKKPQKCGVCDKEISEEARPPYGLVGRLNGVSRMHRQFLAGPVRKWPIGSGYFTSSRSQLMLLPDPPG